MTGNGKQSGKLIIVSAPSGAGKTTLCNKLLEDFRGKLELSVSCTTRAPRKGEAEGRHYFFVDEKEFLAKVERGEFAEWAPVHGHRYGTLKSTIEAFFAAGKSVLLEIDVQGATSLRAAYPGRHFSVFIAPPSLQELERRLRARGTDSEEVIQRRLRNATDEMAHLGDFDHQIVNDHFDRAYTELKKLVSKHV